MAFYERLHSLGKIASECGLHLISQQQTKNTKSQASTNPLYTVPKSNVEECVMFCKLFLKAYYGKATSYVQGPSRLFSALLNLQVIFLLVQSYSISGEYDKTIAYSTECLDGIHTIKQQYSSESTSSDELMMSKIEEKCIFYRGYSSHKLGLFTQAERDLEVAESVYSVSSCAQEEYCSPIREGTINNSRKYYHLMNIQFTLINNHIKLKQFQQSLEYFIKLISLMRSATDSQQIIGKSSITIESMDEKSWNLLNLWFPGLPYFFLAEFLYKQQDYLSSNILFEKYSNYEQGRKLSVHKHQKQTPPSNPSKDKQLVHAMSRINQINSVIQSDQEY
ncbi:predicted protein [Naegleria gruberi]|uniref:Predicted protein n=1 Tax=Naegleria gruberi TaxID=5762 RepID=D2VY29_NAEGR|nr:uncharacterized protein NAEGRDRAFT_73951 [Naegleria gruberi]EFC38252.1 predicted protein [Naegleria gruberi]|eukprot:XP_002670996.1 predicted protein [Naegleria gruberi strain NEG-M]